MVGVRSAHAATKGHLLGCALALAACTDAGFQPVASDDLDTFDPLLTIRGRFCTEPAEEIVFPVKVLFLTDQSASLQCTDPDNRRFAAIDDIVSRLRANPHVSFGAVGFSSWSRELAFTRDRAALDAVLDPAGGLGPATDYQGALATAMRLLEADMIASEPGQRARTKYVLVFVSDGVAEPRCNAGCEDDRQACGDGEDDDGDGLADAADPDCAGVGNNATHPDNLYGVCNTTQEVPDDVYVDYDGICPAYNQPNQILYRVAELLGLADTYGVGELTLHTVLLFAPQDVVEARCPGASASFGYNGALARALLQAMAQEGGGTFRDVDIASGDRGFLDFDFTALVSPQGLVGLSAFTLNARRDATGALVPDSDGDGLSDDLELAQGLDPARRGSDGDDPYGDLFEARHRDAGFDPDDASLPSAPCDDGEDLDGDGLTGCEEAFLGTRARAPDTDGDGMLDGVELVVGTDPATADAEPDLDFDQIANGEEVLAATDPRRPDAELHRTDRIRYALTDLGELEVRRDGRDEVRHCYEVSVSRIPLVTPLHAAPRGLNRVLLHSFERPILLSGVEARVHVACVDALYLGPTDKDPESGVVDWRPAAWGAWRQAVYDRIDAIAACDPASPGVGSYRRQDLDAFVDACLPPRVEIDRTLWRRQDLKALAQELLSSSMALRTPDEPSALFVPIETFDAATDCFRPRRVDELLAFLDHVWTTCDPCPVVAPDGADDDGGAP